MSLFGKRSQRVVDVEFLVRDPNLLHQYPFRYALLYTASPGVEAEAATSGTEIDRLFWAVELLEAQGWDAVAWDLEGRRYGVVVRRRELPPHAPYQDHAPEPGFPGGPPPAGAWPDGRRA